MFFIEVPRYARLRVLRYDLRLLRLQLPAARPARRGGRSAAILAKPRRAAARLRRPGLPALANAAPYVYSDSKLERIF